MRRLLARIALLLFVATPAAADTPSVVITDFGLYAAGPMTHVPEAGQLSGQRWQAEVRHLETAETIPGQLGRIFGIRFRVNDRRLVGQTLISRIRHPKLTAENGRSATESAHTTRASAIGSELGHFFAFEYSYEIAEGDWTFEVVHNGRVLAAKKFRVIVNMY
jgi:hypothetical protein